MSGRDAAAENPTRLFYDRISKAYDSIADSNEHVAREKGQTLLALQPGESVLEIGFGPGRALVWFAGVVGPSGQVTGLDISPGMVEVARKRLDAENVGLDVQLDVGDARQMSYPDDHFDAVFSSFTLELFPLEDIPAVLAEIRRVLKPGGRLGVVSMATAEHDNTLTKVYKWFHRHFPHFVDCQPIDAVGFIRDAGYEIAQHEQLEIWSLPVSVLVAKA